MGIVLGIWYAIIVSSGYAESARVYDAPIPERCETFEQATDSTNGNAAFCKAWFDAHRTDRAAK